MDYNKKQMAPLIEKYQIDVESKLFRNTVELFAGQPNYQLWAVKCIFSNVISFEDLEVIKKWLENNSSKVKLLSKQNVVSYSNKTTIAALKSEINSIEAQAILMNTISKFNTQQRDILKSTILGEDTKPCEIIKRQGVRSLVKLFKKFEKLSEDTKKNIYISASTMDNYDDIIDLIKSSLKKSYAWNKEDMLAFMENNTKCEKVFENGDTVVIKVPDFTSSKRMCGGGRTTWCITRTKNYFRNYVNTDGPTKVEQYFLFDFSKPEIHQLAHVGFTVKGGIGITDAHSCRNSDIRHGTIEADGKRHNIDSILSDNGLSLSMLMRIDKNENFDWNMESFLKFLDEHKYIGTVNTIKGSVVVININDQTKANMLYKNTYLNPSVRYYDEKGADRFIIMNFSLPYENGDSIMVVDINNDEYNVPSISYIKNGYNQSVSADNVMKATGFDVDSLVNREGILPTILLHKFIDEHSEEKAIELIKEQGPSFDVNFDFKYKTPVLSAIYNNMPRLFKTIVTHPNFDLSRKDGYGETLLMSLISYRDVSDEEFLEGTTIDEMIDDIISNCSDLNDVDFNNDSAFMLACQSDKLTWLVEKMIANPNVNVNIVNDFGWTAMTNLVHRHDFKCIELLAARKDYVFRNEDVQEQFAVTSLRDVDNASYVSNSVN